MKLNNNRAGNGGIMETTQKLRVHLELIAPKAKEVFVAGSFNDWHPAVAPMISLENGKWAKELMLSPGRYEYRFIVDGEWADDPAARTWATNPFGGVNAVLEVIAPAPAKAASAKGNEVGAARNPPPARITKTSVPALRSDGRKATTT
jgi:Glycogen recognition site of AMP-activated protein kinase